MGTLRNFGNWNETLGSFGRFQRTIAPPVPPQYLHPTITGSTVALLDPGGVVVISVLAVQSVFVVAWVEKSGGGTVIVDTIIRAPVDEVGAGV